MAQSGATHVQKFLRFRQDAKSRYAGRLPAKVFFRHPLLSFHYKCEQKAEMKLSKAFSHQTLENLDWAVKDSVFSARCRLFGARKLVRLYTIKRMREEAIKNSGQVGNNGYRHACLLHSIGLGPKPVPAVGQIVLFGARSLLFSN
ncbi:MAG: hypothetical protein WCY41_02135 [Candidatus Micrarchaeia archaeon]